MAKDREGPRGSPGFKDILAVAEAIRSQTRIDAVIKTVKSKNEYLVDIYGAGFNVDRIGNIQADPTKQDFPAYSTYRDDFFQEHARVQVVIIKDISLIVPPAFPTGTGQGKVVGIFDQGIPGFLTLNYPIIHNRPEQ